jgi:hypothetical protein
MKKYQNVPNKILRYFFVAVIVTITFIILISPLFYATCNKYITDRPSMIFLIQIALIFTITYIATQILIRQCFYL